MKKDVSSYLNPVHPVILSNSKKIFLTTKCSKEHENERHNYGL
jgi:hypothetical protein